MTKGVPITVSEETRARIRTFYLTAPNTKRKAKGDSIDAIINRALDALEEIKP